MLHHIRIDNPYFQDPAAFLWVLVMKQSKLSKVDFPMQQKISYKWFWKVFFYFFYWIFQKIIYLNIFYIKNKNQVLGTPSENDMKFLTEDNARKYL